ncbi:MAG: cache domain-containing protein [Treponema sp.]|jgi:hypothetical protein|nr:cache domain-containing protein [Treponema sp.]
MNWPFREHRKILFASVFAFFALAVLVSYFFLSRIVERQMAANAEETLKNAAVSLRAELRKAETVLNGAAVIVENGLEHGTPLEEIQDYITRLTGALTEAHGGSVEYVDVYGLFGDNFITGLEWEMAPDYYPRQRAWYAAAERARGGIGYTRPYIDIVTGKPVISLAKTLGGNGGAQGVISLDIDYAAVSTFILSLEASSGGYGMLAGEDFSFFVHPENQRLDRLMEGLNSRYRRLVGKLRSGEAIPMEKISNLQGLKVAVFFMRLYNGWYLGIAVPLSVYYRNIYFLISSLSAAGILSMIFLFLFSRRRPNW